MPASGDGTIVKVFVTQRKKKGKKKGILVSPSPAPMLWLECRDAYQHVGTGELGSHNWAAKIIRNSCLVCLALYQAGLFKCWGMALRAAVISSSLCLRCLSCGLTPIEFLAEGWGRCYCKHQYLHSHSKRHSHSKNLTEAQRNYC